MTTQIVVGAISAKAHLVASDLLGNLLQHSKRTSTATPWASTSTSPNDAGKMSLLRYTSMLASAAQESGRTHLGLEMASAEQPISHKIFGDLFDYAPTVGDALDALARYFPATQTGTTVKIEQSHGMARFIYDIDDLTVGDRLQDAAYTLGKVWRSLRKCAGACWSLDQVTIAAKAPRISEAYSHYFEAPVLFDAQVTALCFPAQLLLQSIPTADLERYSQYCARMELLLPHRDDPALLQDALRAWMMQATWRDDGTLESAAANFGTTARTLQRRLKEQGISFQDLRAQVRMDVAQRMLKESQLPITHIAEKLGFSETSAFTRAFRTHARQSPRAFRQTSWSN
jgi:AraC-like DNA-binding protein